MTKRAVLYARVSGDDRAKEGRNLKGQLEMGRKYALERGYTIVAELAEDERGASGADWDLPQLNKALEMARAGEFDVLIVRELDRFARALAKQIVFEREFKHAGVDIECVLYQYPPTPEGNFNKQIRMVVNEYERSMIVARMIRGRRQSARDGSVLVTKRPPYGYRVVKQGNKYELQIDVAEARIVRLIFQWYIDGDGPSGPLSISGIARKLSDLKVPTAADTKKRPAARAKKRAHGEWSRSTVYQILGNTTYAGTWHYGKHTTVKGKIVRRPKANWLAVEVPALVDQMTWDKAQARLKANKASRKTKYHYLLSGRVTCRHCGHKMVGMGTKSSRRVNRYYRCPVATDKRSHADKCQMRLVSAEYVEPLVWQWVKSWLLDEEQLNVGLEKYRKSREQEVAPLRQELATVEDLLNQNMAELERLLDVYLEGGLLKDALLERKKRYEKTIRTHQSRFDHLSRIIEAATLTQEQVETIRTFAAQIRQRLSYAEEDFQSMRHVLDLLDVQVELGIEDGDQVAYVSCGLGSARLCEPSNSMLACDRQLALLTCLGLSG